MPDPKTVTQSDLQKWIHDVPLAVLDLLPDSPENEVAKSHIRLGYARVLIHLVRAEPPTS